MLAGHSLEEENDDAFHIKGPDGGVFKVAKAHLHHSTVERIRQHFADGGEVKTDADVAAENERIDAAREAGYSAPGVNEAQPDPPADGPANPLAVGRGFGAPGAADMAPAGNAAPASAAAPPGAVVPEASPNPVGPPLSGAGGPPPPEAKPRYSGAASTGNPALDEALNQQIRGISLAATAAGAQGKMDADAQKDYIGKLDAIADDYKTHRAAITQKINDNVEAILGAKVNPNQFWESRSTGQMIMGGLGILLGGISSGLTGQANPALGIIDKAIDRDIDAQKANIKNKQTAIGLLMDQGHDLDSATKIARADAQERVAAQMQLSALKMRNPAAIAAAQQAMASAKAQSVKEIDESAARRAQTQAVNLANTITSQITLPNARVAQPGQQAEARAFGRYWTGQGGDKEAAAFGPKGVVNEGGRLRFGFSEGAGDRVRETQQDMTPLLSTLGRYSDLAVNGHPLNPFHADHGTAATMYGNITGQIKGLETSGRIIPGAAEAIISGIPDISSWSPKDLTQTQKEARINELRREVEQKIISASRANLWR